VFQQEVIEVLTRAAVGDAPIDAQSVNTRQFASVRHVACWAPAMDTSPKTHDADRKIEPIITGGRGLQANALMRAKQKNGSSAEFVG
jgi:hypothetical protein